MKTLWKKDNAGEKFKLKKGWGEDGSWYHGVVYETRITVQNEIVYSCKFDTPTREILDLDTTRTLDLIKAYEDLQAYDSDSDGLSTLFDDAPSIDATGSTPATVVVGSKIRIAQQKKLVDDQVEQAAQRKMDLDDQAEQAAQQKKDLDDQAEQAAQHKKDLDDQADLAAQQKKDLDDQAEQAAQQKKDLDDQAIRSCCTTEKGP